MAHSRSMTGAGMVLASFLALPAQQPTYNVDVSVVNVLATVRDRNGRIVSDLARDDFVLEEDGKRQEIRYFSRQTGLPLTVGLLVDTSMSQRSLIETERQASYQFLEQVLRPEQDAAFVIKFDVEVELLQDLTGSKPLLEAALKLLETPRPGLRRLLPESVARPASAWLQLPGGPRVGIPWPGGGGQRRPGGGQPPPGGGRGPGSGGIGTTLYDAVFLAADELMLKQTGRKAIILISDGVDAGSRLSRQSAIEAALRADTIVYSIRYFDPEAYSARGGRIGGRAAGSRGTETLKTISGETGGGMFEVTKKLTLEQIFARIQEELRNQYNLGYTPARPPDGGFRKIRLTTRDGRLKVHTRPGYYAKPS